ncbi:hypothetical protein D3C87_1768910 [compost metagenome]
MGVDPAHEPVSWRAGRGAFIAVKVAVQRQFVTTDDPVGEHTSKFRMGVQRVVLVKIGHHQPGHWHHAQGVDGSDKGLVVGPGMRRDIVQHQ